MSSLFNPFGFGSPAVESHPEEDEPVVVDHSEAEPVASQSSTASTNTSASTSTALSSVNSPGTALQNPDPSNAALVESFAMAPPTFHAVPPMDLTGYSLSTLLDLDERNQAKIDDWEIKKITATGNEKDAVIACAESRIAGYIERTAQIRDAINKAKGTEAASKSGSGSDRDRHTYQNKISNALNNITPFVGAPMDVHEFIEDIKAIRVLIVKSPDRDTRPWLDGMFFDSVMTTCVDANILKMMTQSNAVASNLEELSEFLQSKCGLDEGYMHKMLKFFDSRPSSASDFQKWCSGLQPRIENLRLSVRADFKKKTGEDMTEQHVWKMLGAVNTGIYVAENATELGVHWPVISEKLDACFDPLEVGKAVKQHREKTCLGQSVAVNNASLMRRYQSVAKGSGSPNPTSRPQHSSVKSQTSARQNGEGQKDRKFTGPKASKKSRRKRDGPNKSVREVVAKNGDDRSSNPPRDQPQYNKKSGSVQTGHARVVTAAADSPLYMHGDE